MGEKWAFAVRDRDDGKGHLKFNNRVIFPNQQGCGSGANPCNYSGKGVVNSGAFLAKPRFVVKVNARAGSSFGFICLVHPGMRKKVRVWPSRSSAISASASRTKAGTRSV